ncbi:hypothetical protein HDG34_000311 [Paraburkholderia sp. HC6.4b]|nr:hypothetical protein [Paraburkholderia sp. HC6.4b]MBB5448794.1 hypothetical protein [Paraburkholderia sp. Kb1A]
MLHDAPVAQPGNATLVMPNPCRIALVCSPSAALAHLRLIPSRQSWRIEGRHARAVDRFQAARMSFTRAFAIPASFRRTTTSPRSTWRRQYGSMDHRLGSLHCAGREIPHENVRLREQLKNDVHCVGLFDVERQTLMQTIGPYEVDARLDTRSTQSRTKSPVIPERGPMMLLRQNERGKSRTCSATYDRIRFVEIGAT